jgi:putative two-component system response regulator
MFSGGYPHGLKGDEIPVSAQIVALVEVYDALSNDRVYRDALPEEKMLSIMEEGKGCQFNPHTFESFLELLPALREIRMQHGDKID